MTRGLTREQFMLSTMVAGTVLAAHAPFCTTDEEEAVKKEYIRAVAERVADLVGNNHVMVADLIDILEETMLVIRERMDPEVTGSGEPSNG